MVVRMPSLYHAGRTDKRRDRTDKQQGRTDKKQVRTDKHQGRTDKKQDRTDTGARAGGANRRRARSSKP